jgi:hypothetical protein
VLQGIDNAKSVFLAVNASLHWLKGTVQQDFQRLVFYESVSPKPLSIPLGPFQIFSKIFGDSSRMTTGVDDAPTANKNNLQSEKCV